MRNNRRKLTRTWLACVCVCAYTHYLCKCASVRVCARDSLQLFTNRRRATTTTTVAQLKSLVCSPPFTRLSLSLPLSLSLFPYLFRSVCLSDFVLISNICNILRLVFNLWTTAAAAAHPAFAFFPDLSCSLSFSISLSASLSLFLSRPI